MHVFTVLDKLSSYYYTAENFTVVTVIKIDFLATKLWSVVVKPTHLQQRYSFVVLGQWVTEQYETSSTEDDLHR